MNIDLFISIMDNAEKLKNTLRHSVTSEGRPESVAEHCWRHALMAMLLGAQMPDVDINKVIRMCLIHDLGEAFTGDIPAFEKTSYDSKNEQNAVRSWISTLPTYQSQEFTALFDEMEKLESREAKLYKALDKLEALIQHNEADIDTWLPLEYELNLTYAEDRVTFSPYLTALRAEIRRITEEKIANECEEDAQ